METRNVSRGNERAAEKKSLKELWKAVSAAGLQPLDDDGWEKLTSAVDSISLDIKVSSRDADFFFRDVALAFMDYYHGLMWSIHEEQEPSVDDRTGIYNIIIDLVDLLDGHRFEAFTEAEKDIFDKSISEKIKKYKSCSKSVNVLSIKCIAAIVALHFRIEEKSNVRGMDLQFDGKKYIQTPRT